MADLDDNQKLRLVLALARFESHTDVSRMMREEYDLDVPIRQVGGYDPTKGYFDAGQRWLKVWEEERQRHLTEVRDIPIANQGFRLQELQRSFDKAAKTGNRVLANQTLRQAAEEVGGALTNERNVKVTRPVDELTPDERRDAFAELIRKAMDAPKVPTDPPAQPTTH
jgi:hypothetical protein